ncbi:MFS transporter [Chondrinema litorale]|uniref:MFS transporter n=1 Tax=Chondrinema litorale TaxID=2994555 RepID=UPI0025436288|nr:MFS transporter [Chondrinema litorale]UZR94778.1 MFS transporter [Chondrinema litorale]
MSFKKNQKKVINGWCLYDWANSVYTLTISSTIFPVYYNQMTRSAFNGDLVTFFGFQIENTVLYSYSLSFSFLVIVLIAPILSGIADYGGMKKTMMKIFTFIGAFSCIALFFFDGKNIEWGIIFCMLASLGWAGSLVFYNAFLPEIATEDKFDTISAKGFAMGYIGSVLQLVASLVILMKPEWFGIESDTFPAKFSFLTVGIWWIVFSQISFYFLPNNIHERKINKEHIFNKGFNELKKVYYQVQKNDSIKRYLIAFFFYNSGVQTVMLLAATFGEKALSLKADNLILTILIIQLVAIPGAYLFAKLSEWKGNRFSLIVMVVIWIFACLDAYILQTHNEFYILAFFVGLVMGGIQSLSRSTYSKLIPEDTIDTASYFSFYDVTEKTSIVIGTFSYGAIEQLTGNMRNSALFLVLFFTIGLYFLYTFKMKQQRSLAV